MKRKLFYITALIFILAAGAAAALRLAGPLVKSRIRSELFNRTGLNLNIGEFRMGLLSGIRAKDIFLGPSPGESLFQIKEFKLLFAPPGILKRQVNFSSLEIKGMKASSEILKSFRGEGEEKRGKGSALSLGVGDIILKDSELYLEDGKKVKLSLNGGSVNLKSSGDFTFLLKDLNLTKKGQSLNLNLFQAGGQIRKDKTVFKKLFFSFPSFKLSGHLYFENIDPRSIGGDMKASGSPENLINFAGRFFSFNLPPLKLALDADLSISGTGKDPDIGFKARSRDFSVDQRYFSSATIEGGFSSGIINIKEAEIKDPRGSFINIEGRYSAAQNYAEGLKARLKIDPFSGAFRIPGINEDLAGGNLIAEVELSGPLARPGEVSASSRILLKGAHLNEKKISDMEGIFNLHQGRGLAELKSEELKFEAEGLYGEKEFSGDFKVNIFSLEHLAFFGGLEKLNGSLELKGGFSGREGNIEGEAEIKSASINYKEIPLNLYGGRMVYENRELTLKDITGGGTFNAEEKEIILQELPSASGRFLYDLKIQGSPEDISADFSLNISSPAGAGFKAGQFFARGGYRNEKVFLDSFFIRDGEWLFLSPLPLDILAPAGEINLKTYEAPGAADTDPAAVIKDAEEKFKSAGDMVIEYDYTRRKDITLKAREKGLEIRALEKILNIPSTLAGRVSFQAELGGLPDLPSGEVKLTIKEAQMEGVEISRGRLQASLKDGNFSLKEFNLIGPEIGEASAFFSYKAYESGELNQFFMPRTGKNSHGKISINNLDLNLLNMFTGNRFFTGGRASGELGWEGALKDIPFTGNLNISNAGIILDSGESLEEIEFKGEISDRTLFIKSLSAPYSKTRAGINGAIKAVPRGDLEWDLTVSLRDEEQAFFSGSLKDEEIDALCTLSRFELSGLEPFLTGAGEITGVVRGRVEIKGPLKDPGIDGTLEADGLGAKVPVLEKKIRAGELKILFDRQKIKIDRLDARAGNGSLSLSGKITHRDRSINEVLINAAARDLNIYIPALGRGSLKKTDITLSGSGESFKAEGKIEAEEFFITAEEPAGTGEPEEVRGFLNKLNLNLIFLSGEKFWVGNRAGRIRLEGELRSSGTAESPLLTGRFETREGYVMYLDRKFTISEGYADFDGRPGNLPYVDIRAGTRVRSLRQEKDIPYDISLHARGRVDSISIDLSSDPQLPFPDIVSLLTFGATRSELTEAESIITLRAAELAGRRVAGYISAYAGNMLNLDLMLIEGNVFRAGSAHGPRIQAQKGISRNFALAYVGNLSPEDSAIVARRTAGRAEITYTEGIGRTEDQKLQVSYRLTPSLWAEGLMDEAGRSNIGLKYSIWIR